jgi:hypothetical protein
VHIERKSLFVVADLVASGNADLVATRVVKRFKKLPAFTITYDRGSEFALWKYVQEELDIRVFFAEPHPSMGARDVREHEWIDPALRAEEIGALLAHTSEGGEDRLEPQPPPTQVPQMENAVPIVWPLLPGNQRTYRLGALRGIVGHVETAHRNCTHQHADRRPGTLNTSATPRTLLHFKREFKLAFTLNKRRFLS